MTRRTFLAAALAKPDDVRLSGTFLQLNSGHFSWPDSNWEILFNCFSRLRLERLIVQWTQNEETRFLDLIPMIFERAARASLRVELGLVNSHSFWTMTPDSAEGVFSEIYKKTIPLIEDLRQWTRKAEFGGWYIPQEFEDVRWTRKNMRQNGGEFIRAVTRAARKAAPRSHVAISAFSNGKLPPDELAKLWHEALRFGKVDELLFQDGIGVGKLTLESLPAYENALAKKLRKRFTPVVEIFEQVRSDPFAAVPALPDRIRRQLAIAGTAGVRKAVAFSIPEYMSPLGGEAAIKLLEAMPI